MDKGSCYQVWWPVFDLLSPHGKEENRPQFVPWPPHTSWDKCVGGCGWEGVHTHKCIFKNLNKLKNCIKNKIIESDHLWSKNSKSLKCSQNFKLLKQWPDVLRRKFYTCPYRTKNGQNAKALIVLYEIIFWMFVEDVNVTNFMSRVGSHPQDIFFTIEMAVLGCQPD